MEKTQKAETKKERQKKKPRQLVRNGRSFKMDAAVAVRGEMVAVRGPGVRSRDAHHVAKRKRKESEEAMLAAGVVDGAPAQLGGKELRGCTSNCCRARYVEPQMLASVPFAPR